MIGNFFLILWCISWFTGHQSYVLLCTETTLSNPPVVQPKSSCNVHLLRSPWLNPRIKFLKMWKEICSDLPVCSDAPNSESSYIVRCISLLFLVSNGSLSGLDVYPNWNAEASLPKHVWTRVNEKMSWELSTSISKCFPISSHSTKNFKT